MIIASASLKTEGVTALAIFPDESRTVMEKTGPIEPVSFYSTKTSLSHR
jgi:hypothetical protein